MVCAAIVALVAHFRNRFQSTHELLARLPADEAVILSIDFAALRRAGVLRIFEGSDLLQEPEYQAFKAGSGFDYLRDLDWVLASLGPGGSYFMLRGRFDWNSLSDYVTRQGGACYNSFCRASGSAPDRKISYFPLQSDVMALAIAKDEYAASQLLSRRPGTRPAAWRAEPVWFFIPASRLRQTEAWPAGARSFAGALGASEGILLLAGPRGNRWEVVLEVTCRSSQEASELAGQLGKLTALLREMMARENKPPDPRHLSGLLTAGVFDAKGGTVHGRWPLERAFLEALAGGAP